MIQHRRIIPLLCAGLLCASCSTQTHTSVEEQLRDIQQRIAAGQINDTIVPLKLLAVEYPEHPAIPAMLASIYDAQANYAQSVQWYEQALEHTRRADASSPEAARIHNALVNSYNELGQQRYFSTELCLRILYHMEHAWSHVTTTGYAPE